ncbi:MAG: phosphoenolpyruvate--protein phosphotransferase [Clostridia bacterium]|nr:phosphoenolpyruvate--protein phosphotransferase [Clostridia bacterium]
MLKGIAASPGVALGKVLIKKEETFEIKQETVLNATEEIDKFNAAISQCETELQKICQHTKENIGEEEALIFEAHIMILQDIELLKKVKEMIQTESTNAAYALSQVRDEFISIFEMMEDAYLKERAADIKDVTDRVIRILLGIQTEDLSHLDEHVIIVAKDLTPSDTAQLDKEKVIGFITETGGSTSHSAIMARTLEIPAVVGVKGALENIKDDDFIAYDGDEGCIYVNPDESCINMLKKKQEEYNTFKESLKQLIGQNSISKDEIQVELAANIGTPDDLEGVLKNDAEGIGLYRSEFLYMDRNNLPSEDEQFEAYKKVAEGMENKPVVIRTLDVGGDKEINYLDLPKEMNPFLGYRAIRVCLDRKDIFKTQLRALLRASHYGNIKIMFPMISSVEEIRSAKAILSGCKKELQNENLPFNENIEVGIMIEIPAAAVISDLLAKEVDFFSIGTNDLIQYTVAVDRMNQSISYLYTPFHPALLRLIKTVIDNGHNQGIWVGMCGEVAGNPDLIPILLGMGLDEFSMSAGSVLKARYIVKNTSQALMAKKIDDILNLSTAEEVKQYINQLKV